MFAKCPPTIIPHLLKALIWSIKKRYIFLHPFPRLTIWDGLNDIFILHSIKIVYIMLIICRLKQSCSCIDIIISCLKMSNLKHGQRITLSSLFKCSIPIRLCINGWEGTILTCTEKYSINSMSRGKEHTLGNEFTVTIEIYTTTSHRKG